MSARREVGNGEGEKDMAMQRDALSAAVAPVGVGTDAYVQADHALAKLWSL